MAKDQIKPMTGTVVPLQPVITLLPEQMCHLDFWKQWAKKNGARIKIVQVDSPVRPLSVRPPKKSAYDVMEDLLFSS